MRYVTLCLAAGLILAVTATAGANTVESSTMWFQGQLEDNGGGVYTGTVSMINEAVLGVGDSIAGFDVYARNGAVAMYDKAGAGQDYAHGVVIGHDAYTTAGGWGSFYNPDCADWDHYQIEFSATSWALQYNGNTGPGNPAGTAMATPMSGAMNWATGLASEDDVGTYYAGQGPAESPGYATNNPWANGGAGYWDMDWSWGSESIPLQYGDFKVQVTSLGEGQYEVSLTPAVPEPLTMMAVFTGIAGLAGYIRKRKIA